ncbi:MAG: HAD-IB family phosphatase [Hyphomicrobium aestuarii]|nr:HAD-IB family phosphatase [Hyphomicrobium aestuarii]
MTGSLLRFGAVAFDCDSTLSSVEGIDELARRSGCFDEIEPLTAMAMDGRLTIDQVYGRRMDLVRPDRAALDWLAGLYIETVTTGAAETIMTLREAGVAVHVVSGGLRPAILPLAAHLGIAPHDVHAVDVSLGPDGNYLGYQTGSPLTRPDGKAAVCRELAARHGPVAMIGDGTTDVAARSGGAFVVGYGGVVARDAVRASADVFVTDAALTAILPILLNGRS